MLLRRGFGECSDRGAEWRRGGARRHVRVRSGSAGEGACIGLEDAELRAPWYYIGVLAGLLRCSIFFGNLHGSSIHNMLVVMTNP